MDFDKGMAETVASVMPTAAEIAACKWLPDNELAVYTAEYERTGFQGGLQGYRRTGPDSSPTCKHSAAVRSTYPRYSSAAKAIGAFFKIPVHWRGCRQLHARRCAGSTL